LDILSDKLPNFFVVGAQRAGSTSLYEFLKQTEDVFVSHIKEPNYFTSIDGAYLSPPPIRDEKKYLRLFKKVKDEKAIGDCSPIYLRDPKSAELIHKVIPDAKIVIILRDPVERAYSQYLLRVSNGMTLSFSEAIKMASDENGDDRKGRILNAGWYFEQVKKYLDTFGAKQVKILIFEEFVKDPKKSIKEILEFLGVDSDPPESIDVAHNLLTKPRGKLAVALLQNKIIRQAGRKVLSQSAGDIVLKKILGKKIDKPKMPQQDRLFLEKLYRDDVKKLEKMLGKQLPWS